ncbi:MAG TPA: PilZ domain-containing protein [Nitrospirota bacterium]|jgi:hypothetical protein
MPDYENTARENAPFPSEQDKRTAPRKVISLIPFEISDEPGQKFGFIINVSRTGLMVQTASFIYKGSLLDLSFNLPQTAGRVSCMARVTWTRMLEESHTMRGGLEFEQISPESADIIDQFVKTQED